MNDVTAIIAAADALADALEAMFNGDEDSPEFNWQVDSCDAKLTAYRKARGKASADDALADALQHLARVTQLLTESGLNQRNGVRLYEANLAVTNARKAQENPHEPETVVLTGEDLAWVVDRDGQ